MTVSSRHDDQRSRLQRALVALKQMRAKLAAAECERTQPIAIIGMSCRFPGGANSPDAYWELLHSGRDGISEVPPDRWDINAWYDPNPDAPGKVVTRYGGFLDHVDLFDPQFFGISPREAVHMDPQQRLLLEVAWEALEDAAIAPEHCRERKVGVFVGISSNEYGELLMAAGPKSIHYYAGSGNARSVAAGRLSYVLGLVGPSLSIDTACSSSLVAVHLGCQALRTGECALALAGGVNVLLTPTITVNHSRARMLAPDGRSKTFDAAADGFVRSEGCGLVVLKRLDDALADRDDILAVIRGSATNQDGHTSGLTVPHGPSQQAVITAALQAARLQPQDIGHVEAHGTGTSLGDPIELNALGAVFGGQQRPDGPLVVSSVKTNIGHAEAAAGIAGLIKVVLSLRHETIPPHLHFDRPTPHFAWDEFPLTVPHQRLPWPAVAGRRRVAGVSSFGFGGTNAHLVIEEAPRSAAPPAQSIPPHGRIVELPPPAGDGERPLHVLPLSAPTAEGLQRLAGAFRCHIDRHPDLRLADVCHTAGVGRSHFRHRLAVVGDSLAHVTSQLTAVANGQCYTGAVVGDGGVEPPRIAFLFTGQGAQHVDMGRQLYQTHPEFRETIHRCDEFLRAHLDRPLRDVLYPPMGVDSPIDETAYTQPALFAFEVALAELWKSWGIVPDAVMGHSLGEYVAACVAGVFSLEDGLRLIAARARLMQTLPRQGCMAAILADPGQVREALKAYAPEVTVAADNGPQNTVVSGRNEDVATVVRQLQAKGIQSRPLNVSHAFHSPLVEPMLAEFAEVAATVDFSRPVFELVSNLTGAPVDDDLIDPDYWCRHACDTVRFADSIRGLWARGYRVFVETGPKPVLLSMARHCVPHEPADWLPSLRTGCSDWQQMLESLATLYVRGARVQWDEYDRHETCRRLRLPTYPFQRRRYWVNVAPSSGATPPSAATPTGHRLLGERVDCARHPAEVLFQTVLSSQSPAYLDDHRVVGKVILPAAGYLEMAWAAGVQAFGTEWLTVENIRFHQALILFDATTTAVQFSVDRRDGSFQIHSRDAEGSGPRQAGWTLHASGTIRALDAEDCKDATADKPGDLSALIEKNTETVSCRNFYSGYRDRGIEFGPAFQAVNMIWRRDEEVFGEIALPADCVAGDREYHLHPVLLDACAQLVGAAGRFSCAASGGDAARPGPVPTGDVWLQTGIDRFRIFGRPISPLWGHARIRSAPGAPILVADVRLLDGSGTVLAEVIGQRAERVNKARLLTETAASVGSFYEVRWLPRPRADRVSKHGRAVAAGSVLTGDLGDFLAQRVHAQIAKPEIASYAALLNELESLSALYIGQALARMGWALSPGDRLDPSELIRRLHVQAPHRRLFLRLLEIVASQGCMRREEKQWRVLSELPGGDLQRELDRVRRQHPAAHAELDLLDYCGSKLADVLQGRCDPLELIFPGGDLTKATSVYRDSPGARAINGLLQEGVRRAVDMLPADARLRVMEIGAGTGGTAAYILPALPVERVDEYVFTDISPRFLSAARENFADYPFVRFDVLDIERSPAEQGFAGQRFDMVIAANVLHATRHLPTTVRHVSQLMAHGGLLWLLENTSPSSWVDLIWGLTDGWWRFDDPLRSSHPLLSGDGWQRLLQESGCPRVECIAPDPQRCEILSRQSIIVAQWANARPSAAAEEVGEPNLALGAPANRNGTSSGATGTWLLIADREGDLAELSEILSAHGVRTVRASTGPCCSQHSETEFTVDSADPASFARLLQNVADCGDRLCGIVFARGLAPEFASFEPAPELPASALSTCMELVRLVQAVHVSSTEPPPRLWIVTRAAQSVRDDASRLRLRQSPLWGIGKVIALEHPEMWGGMVDLDPSPTPGEFALLFDELSNPDDEDQVALRAGHRYGARLVPSGSQQEYELPVADDGSYLITGGCGAFGLQAAAWLVGRGARHVVLVGRHGASTSDALSAIAALEQLGAEVCVEAADVSDQECMGRVLGRLTDSGRRLRGIVHAAGVPGYCPLADLEEAALRDSFAAKVTGTWVLHRLTEAYDLDFFVCCSSMVSVWGAKGQSHYVAANHFLDVYAHYRRARGLQGLCVNWGPLTGGGMLPAEVVADLRRIGVSTSAMAQAVGELGRLPGVETVQAALVDIDWRLFKSAYESRRRRPLFELVGVDGGRSEPQQGAVGLRVALPPAARGTNVEMVRSLRSATLVERRELLAGHIQHELAAVLGLDEAFRDDTGFFDLGMDSLTAMDFKTRLEHTLEFSLPSTLAFDYSTIETLVEYLAAEHLGNGTSAVDAPRETTAARVWDDPSAGELRPRVDIEQISEDEVMHLLMQKLNDLGGHGRHPEQSPAEDLGKTS